MNLRSVDLNLLTVFDAVITEQNMTRAAEKIGMSQPALSLAINRFRHMAKDELFFRAGRGVQPTPRALELAIPVRRALDIVLSALDQGREFDPLTASRSFNLALGEYGEYLLLPELINWLDRNNPGIKIFTHSIESIDIAKELHFGKVDLYLWAQPVQNASDEFVSKQIGADPHVCLFRKDHPKIGDEISLKEYSNLNHITMKIPASYGPSHIEELLWDHGLERSSSVKVHSMFEYPQLLCKTDLISTLPSKIANEFATTHDLRVLPCPVPFDSRGLKPNGTKSYYKKSLFTRPSWSLEA